MTQTHTYDVTIHGTAGLYSARFETPNARGWFRRNLKGPRTVLSGALIVEGADRCRDLVTGMVAAGLRVSVNGVDMKGFGQKEEATT